MDVGAAQSGGRRALQYDGTIGGLYGVFLVNLLLSFLTLGIFRFWAISRTRRYLWMHTGFQGQRFSYTGTGLQLFVGYLLAFAALLGIGLVAALFAWLLGRISPGLAAIPVFAAYVFILVLAAGALFSAQRYRLSHTEWCGIRGGMTGSMIAYGARVILYMVLMGLTLAQLAPWVTVRLAERRINASSFGHVPFQFQGRAGELYGPFLITLLGVLVLAGVISFGLYGALHQSLAMMLALGNDAPLGARLNFIVGIYAGFIVFAILGGLIGCWYRALVTRHIVGRTRFGAHPLGSTVQGGGLAWLLIGNLLLLVFTLGLGWPIVTHRNMRFVVDNLWIDGVFDTRQLIPSAAAPLRFGEGLYEQLDHGGVF